MVDDIAAMAAAICSFYERLTKLDRLVREVANPGDLRALIRLKDVPKDILLDFSTRPVSVECSDTPKPHPDVTMAAKVGVMHRLLLGATPFAVEVNQRRVLMRGAMTKMIKLFPLLRLAPVLYREHVAKDGTSDGGRVSELTRAVGYWTGYLLGTIKRRYYTQLDLFGLLESVSKGLEDADQQG